MKTYHLTGKAPYFTNCYVMTDNDGNAVMIEASADVNKVQDILDNDRVQLKAILLTHGHADHRETLEQCREKFGCPVYISAADSEFFGISDTLPLTDGENLTFGQIKIQVISTPGHTPGGCCLVCEDMLFSGDTLFAGTVGRTDLGGGDFDTLMKSLEKLSGSVKENLKVLPGHNHFSTMELEKENNPYLKNIR